MNKIAIWLFDNVYLGRFAPYVLGFIIGSTPVKIEELTDGYSCPFCGAPDGECNC